MRVGDVVAGPGRREGPLPLRSFTIHARVIVAERRAATGRCRSLRRRSRGGAARVAPAHVREARRNLRRGTGGCSEQVFSSLYPLLNGLDLLLEREGSFLLRPVGADREGNCVVPLVDEVLQVPLGRGDAGLENEVPHVRVERPADHRRAVRVRVVNILGQKDQVLQEGVIRVRRGGSWRHRGHERFQCLEAVGNLWGVLPERLPQVLQGRVHRLLPVRVGLGREVGGEVGVLFRSVPPPLPRSVESRGCPLHPSLGLGRDALGVVEILLRRLDGLVLFR